MNIYLAIFELLALTSYSTAQIASSERVCDAQPVKEKQEALLKYVRKQYKIPAPIPLALVSERLFPNSCFRELTVEGKGSIRTWRITLYASPDYRFLTTDLLDTTVDPEVEERRRNQEALIALSANKAAAVGSPNATVSVIEFADFQCPFCRSFATLAREVVTEHRGTVRLVFHHLPLTNHSWARMAAEGAACAQLQSSDAFWSLHDQLFAEQSRLTAENIKDHLFEYANHAPLEIQLFRECLQSQMSVGLVLQDLDLASTYDVRGHPPSSSTVKGCPYQETRSL